MYFVLVSFFCFAASLLCCDGLAPSGVCGTSCVAVRDVCCGCWPPVWFLCAMVDAREAQGLAGRGMPPMSTDGRDEESAGEVDPGDDC